MSFAGFRILCDQRTTSAADLEDQEDMDNAELAHDLDEEADVPDFMAQQCLTPSPAAAPGPGPASSPEDFKL